MQVGRTDAIWRQQVDRQARDGDSLRMIISKGCVQPLCLYLLHGPQIANRFRYINLSKSGIGKGGAAHIAGLIGQNDGRLLSLDLSSNSIGNGGLADIQNALQRNHFLQELHLKNNHVTANGIALICQGLAHGPNQALRLLDLSVNPKIGDNGAETLVEDLLWEHRARLNLTELRLAQCLIGDEAARRLGALFGGTPSTQLERLDLSDNLISNHGADSFLRPFGDRRNSLRVLDLRENRSISRNKCQELRAAADNGNKRVLL